MADASPFWAPHVYADRRPRLAARRAVTRACRNFFEGKDFVEVETSALQVSPGNETHLTAFSTHLLSLDGRSTPLHLHTSPEFACKKLLAAGEERIFTLAHVFRNGERTALHHPEFTMLEWYRAGAPYSALMDDCADLLSAAARAAGATHFVWRGRTSDPFAAPERLSVAAAFHRYAGVDLLATLGRPDDPDRDALATQARAVGLRVAPDDTWSDLFSKLLSDRVEPHLGMGRATILDAYPACEAALARIDPADPRVAQRFELYVCGVELANGFGELTDPVVQRARFVAAMDQRRVRHGATYPLDEDFLAALAIMPEASGIALGLDRLVMLATGATRIEDVLWTPVVEPQCA
jgi:lysyl-tRNA synthetase class 2